MSTLRGIAMTKNKWEPLTNEENALAVKAFNGAAPGVFGVAEAIDEMLRTLANLGVIKRAGSATKGRDNG